MGTMTDTPNTTNVTTAPAQATPTLFGSYMTWFKAHERLIIIAAGAYLLLHFYDRGLSAWQQHDQTVAMAAGKQVTTDTALNKGLTDQLAQLKSNADAKTAALDAEIKQTTLSLQKQQAQDAQATQQQILDRWKLLLPMKPGAVQTSGMNDILTADAANQTVQALERIPVLEMQAADLNIKILLDDQIIGKQDDLITGLNHQLIDEHASHVADVNLEKVKAKKSFVKGLKIGFIAGVVFTEGIHLALGKP
jgi:hypothetical protein